MNLHAPSAVIFSLAFSLKLALAQGTPDLRWMVSGGRSGNITFSPDGKYLLCDGAVWSVPELRLVRTLSYGSSEWFPDGTRIATAAGNEVHIWRFADGQLLLRLTITNDSLTDIALSTDGSVVAAGTINDEGWDEPAVVKVWRASDGALLRTLVGHDGHVKALAFGPDTNLLVSVSRDRTLILWRLNTGEILRRIGLSDGGSSVAFSPDGSKIVAAAENRYINVFRTSDGSLLLSFRVNNSNETYPVAFSPDGALLASDGDYPWLHIWRLSDGAIVSRVYGHDETTGIAFSPDGKLLASSGEDAVIRLWELSTTNLLAEASARSATLATTFSPDGTLLAIGGYDWNIYVLRSTNGVVLQKLTGHDYWITALAFSPDGALLASGGGDGRYKIWRVSDWSLLRTVDAERGGVQCLAFSPDGALLATGGSSGPNLDPNTKLWRVADGSNVLTLPGISSAVNFSPDGTLLAAAQGSVNLWNVQDGALSRKVTTSPFDFYGSLAFTPDGLSLLGAGRYDAVVRQWRISDGQLQQTFAGHNGGVSSLSMAPDGRSFLAGGYYLWFWRIADGTLLHKMDQEISLISSLAFSPSGNSFAYGRDDGVTCFARAPLWIASIEIAGGDKIIRWQGGSGRYQLERATNLLTGYWADFGNVVTGYNSTISLTNSTGFFRIQSLDDP